MGIYTVTLDNQGATTAGTTTIYESYGVKYSLTSNGNAMTTTTNKITVPARTGYTFGGYYTEQNGNGKQMIQANGFLAEGASTKQLSANGTFYAKWTENEYTLVNISNINILENGDFEAYSVIKAPSKTANGVTHTWDGTLNGIPGDTSKAYSATSWGAGNNMGVGIPEIGYHAHMKMLNSNAVFTFKTNEDYVGKSKADLSDGITVGSESSVTLNRWLGVSQEITGSKLTPGKTYAITMDVYRVSGTSVITSGLHYATNANTTKSFVNGKGTFNPSTTGRWETLTWTFTLDSDYLNTTDPSLYIYGHEGGASKPGEIYVDNVRLEEVTTVNKNYGTAYTTAELTTPTRTGYTFDGWYNDADLTTKLTTSNNLNTSTATFQNVITAGTIAKIYAKWTVNNYTIAFDQNYLPGDVYGEKPINTNQWSMSTDASASTRTLADNTAAKYGKEVRLTMNEGTSGGPHIQAPCGRLTVGKTYTWSLYIKASSNKTLSIGHEQSGRKTVNVTTSWQRITHTFTAEDTTYNSFTFYVSGSTWTAGDILYVHSLELAEASGLNVTTQTKTYGTTLGTLTTPSRDGYTFAGWFTAPIGGTQIFGTTTVPAANTTYYAHWTAKMYTLTVKPNGGTYASKTTDSTYTQMEGTVKQVGTSTPPGDVTVTFNGNSGTSETASAKASKTFSSWTKGGTGEYVAGSAATVSGMTRTTGTDNGETFERFTYSASSPTANTWYNARWPAYAYTSGNTYEIRLKLRINSIAESSIGLRHAECNNDYSTSGRVERDFSTTTNGWLDVVLTRTISGTTVTQGTNTVTIAPVFEIYTSNLNGKAASASFDIKDLVIINKTTNKLLQSNANMFWYRAGNGNLTANYSAYSQVTLPNATRTGYTLEAWYDAASGGNKIGAKDAKYTPTGNKTLYAHWTANKYTVTCVDYFVDASNNGKVKLNTATQTKQFDFGTTVSGTSWGTDASRSAYYANYVYKSSTSATVGTSGTTVYRRFWAWTDLNTYYAGGTTQGGATVSFSTNGTNWEDVTNEKNTIQPWGTTYYVKNIRPTNATEEFDKVTNLAWNSSKSYYTYTPTAAGTSMNIYMKYKTYAITLNNQSATSSGTTTIYETYNTKYSLTNNGNAMTTSANKITVPTRTGYTFGGYYTSTNGGGSQIIQANGFLTSGANTKQFSASGTLYAKWTINSYKQIVQVRYQNANGTYGDYTNVIDKNYNYGQTVSWSRAQDTTYNAASITSYTVTAAKTTQVSVTRRTYTVAFNGNSGTNGTSITKRYGEALGTLPTSTRAYYTFDGWYTAASGGTKITATTTMGTGATYYAHWTQASTVILYDNGNECTNITGGWTGYASQQNGTYSKTSNRLKLGYSTKWYSHSAFRTNNKVQLGLYNTLHVNYKLNYSEGNSLSYLRVGFYTGSDNDYIDGPHSSPGTYTDTYSVSGKGTIQFDICTFDADVEIIKVWLTK